VIGLAVLRGEREGPCIFPERAEVEERRWRNSQTFMWWTPSSRVSAASLAQDGDEGVQVLVVGASVQSQDSGDKRADQIARRFINEGTKTLRLLSGEMLALVYESKEDRLHIVTDFDGVYRSYWLHEDELTVAALRLSDISPFVHTKRIRKQGVAEYFQFGYVPSPETIFDNVQVTAPSTLVELSSMASPLIQKRVQERDGKGRRGDPGENVLDLVMQATERRVLENEPVHALLSAGYDSTLCALGLRARTCQAVGHVIGFANRKDNENDSAAKILSHIGIEQNDIYISDNQMSDAFPQWVRSLGQPWAHPNGLSTRVAYQEIAKNSESEVVVNGIGGDALFCDLRLISRSRRKAYEFAKLRGMSFLSLGGSRLFKKLPLGQKLAKLHGLAQISPEEAMIFFNFWKGRYAAELLGERLDVGQTLPGKALLNTRVDAEMRYANYYSTWGYDSSMNRMVDEAAAVGLVGTSPLEDPSLWEYVESLDASVRYPPGRDRILQTELVHRHVPQHFFPTRKWAMETPLALLLSSKSGQDLLERYLNRPSSEASSFYGSKVVCDIWSQFKAGRSEHAMRLWSILVFEAWFQEREDDFE
jgi:asparagine synthase (glutamine-hydrolysing)